MTAITVPGFEGSLGKENKYSNNFFVLVHDFNSDKWNDILIIGFPGQDTSWFENPKGKDGHWVRHKIFDQTDNESPTFADLTGDGKPELVCITKGQYGYAEPDWSDPAKPWTFHAISPNNKYGNFTHGMGLGDVNGDGRLDLLEKDGWWEQPASLAGDPVWRFHPQPMGTGGSQMYAYDVNGDGLNDIITALAAHAFGLAWYEQYREGGAIKFREHVVMNKDPKDNAYGVKFSEIHAIALVDMDGDGLKDIVTGKRFWSHGRTGDPDRNDAAVLYWFKLARSADKTRRLRPLPDRQRVRRRHAGRRRRHQRRRPARRRRRQQARDVRPPAPEEDRHARGVGEGAAEAGDGYRITVKSIVWAARVTFFSRRSTTINSST